MQLHKQSRSVRPGDRVLTHTGRLAFVIAAIVVNKRKRFLIEFVLGGSHRLWDPRKVYPIVTAVRMAIGNGGAS